MSCFSPIKGYYSDSFHKSGKRKLVFDERYASHSQPLKLPCGKCVGCHLETGRQMAVRCVHEAQMHDCNSFITLTYADDKLPSDGSIHRKHIVNFVKRLRFKFGNGIKVLYCGEYGGQTGRPHYHACLFGLDFPDRIAYGRDKEGTTLYTSPVLEQIWGFGNVTVGDVTFQSASYICRYVLKKAYSYDAFDKYVNKETGVYMTPEFIGHSRRPGLGYSWFMKYWRDIYPHDCVVFNGRKMRPPGYYDDLLLKIQPDMYYSIMANRQYNSDFCSDPWDNTQERLYTKEQVKLLHISANLHRNLE